MAIEIGQQAPDVSAPDQDGNPVRIADFQGQKPVLLVFYPFTFTGICEGELCRLRDDYDQFEQAGVQILAISCNAKHVQKRWRDEMGYQFPVLSDFWPHGAVAQAFGVFNEAVGCANRATIAISTDGTVVDVIESGDLGTPREPQRYEDALQKLA
jgi:peroxiredoxin (alkyl hydroperoxide reductase subunit C)